MNSETFAGKRHTRYRSCFRPASIFRLWFFVSLSLAVAGPIAAQVVRGEGMDTGMGGGNTIIGTVYDNSGQRVTRRIQVRLATPTRGERVGMTDDNGNFVFRGLPSGNYAVLIDKEKEYEKFTQAVDILQLQGAPGGTYNVNIRLRVKADTLPKAAVVNSAFANVPKLALELYNKGAELAKAGDHKGAIEQLQLATVEYPAFMLAFNEIGVQYLRLNDGVKADEALVSALKIEPGAFTPLMNRGIANVMMKRYGEAVPILRKAKKIDEASAVCRYFLGQALANLGLFDEAEKELNSAISLGKEEMKEAHRVLAIIYNAKGDKKRAAAALEAYLLLAPTAKDAEQLKTAIRQLKESAEAGQKPSN